MISSKQWSIPGISKIGIVQAKQLPPDLWEQASAGMTVPLAVIPIWIEIFGKASLNIRMISDNVAESKLQFNTYDEIQTEGVAFIAVDRSGEQRLIGALEPPYPKVSLEFSSGDSASEQRKIEVTVQSRSRALKIKTLIN